MKARRSPRARFAHLLEELAAAKRDRVALFDAYRDDPPTYEAKRLEINGVIDELEARLNAAAPSIAIRAGEWRLVTKTSAYTYATQTDRVGYARRSAAMKASEIETLGIEARSRIDPDSDRRFPKFFVEARVATELDAELVRRRPAPELREWLAACWRNGINPRVLNPFLPHGLEERLGVDYQGRIKESARENSDR